MTLQPEVISQQQQKQYISGPSKISDSRISGCCLPHHAETDPRHVKIITPLSEGWLILRRRHIAGLDEFGAIKQGFCARFVLWMFGMVLLAVNSLLANYFSAFVGAMSFYLAFKYIQARKSPLNNIPTIGHSGVFSSYLTAMEWIARGADLLQEGYKTFDGKPFKIATIARWIVVLSGKQYIDDLCEAPPDVLSFDEPAIETTQGNHTFGPGLHIHPHHVTTIRSSVTRNISTKFGEICNEALVSLNDYIPLSQDWVTIPGHQTLLHIVSRTTNRYLVGQPLCHNPDYLFISEQHTVDVVTTAQKINVFPNFLKPLAGRLFGKAVKERIRAAHDLLAPIIEARLQDMEKPGFDRAEMPNDVIAWLLDSATHDYHLSVRDIVLRILVVNFTAIHTSAVGFTQAVYDLAVHPECVNELREEAENAIAEHGWSKASVQKMHKLDSFLKESFRLNGGASLLMLRKTLKDWTLSDGTFIPKDVYVGVAVDAINKAEGVFRNSQSFRGFRFLDTKNGEELSFTKHRTVDLSPEYIVFGHGPHACPGRFLGVNNIKVMLLQILLNYDVQLENGSLERPPNLYVAAATIPNQETRLQFRKRNIG